MAFERFDVLFRHHLELELVPCSARGVAATGLRLAQYCEINSSRLQHARHGNSRFNIAFDKRARATDPEQSIGSIAVSQYFDIQPIRPVAAQPQRLNACPGVSA